MIRFSVIVALVCWIESVGAPAVARAQGAMPGDLTNCRVSQIQTRYMDRRPVKNDQGVDELRLMLGGTRDKPVKVDCDEMQLFADQMVIFEQRKVVATGNVVFVSTASRIAADRLEFDTKTRTGTFYQASGIANLGDRVDRSFFGTQEPDAYFWGDTIDKIGPKKYKITNGGFTTCLQPTPRWQISSGNITVNLDDYAFLTNSIFRVKGVPLMYLPVFYYPIQDDDRATGFLIPNYGTSTLQGKRISNAFFWAISRSQDATVFHDWFTKTGQGLGGEYRYVLGGGSQGTGNVYMLNTHESAYTAADGTQRTLDAKRSYRVTGSLTQALAGSFRARANADYFTDITTQQRYQQNLALATKRTRDFGGNVTGNWREYVLSGTVDRHDIFDAANIYRTTGSLPRISFTRGERAIGRSKLYFGLNSEYVTLVNSATRDDVKEADTGLTRVDVNPVLRIPFTRWPFLSVNSSVSWRGTYWTESLGPANVQVPEGIGRRFFDFQSRITGPVFNRIWSTPGGGYAEKWKHVIEPTLVVQRVTAIDNFDRIVNSSVDGVDRIVGNVTRFVYGVNNRVYAKKTVAREIFSAGITQSYYTDARAALYDAQYQSSFSNNRPTNFSPVRIQMRANPSDRVQGDFSTEWDPTVHTLRTFSASGTVNYADWLQTTAGWSQKRLIPDLQGFDDPATATNYINATANIRRPRNHVGGSYSFNYDLRNDRFLQQRIVAYYNAQCCGIGVEYQTFNFHGGFAGVGIPRDRRFNLSFTLAGIGTFSNLLGAFGGQQGR